MTNGEYARVCLQDSSDMLEAMYKVKIEKNHAQTEIT
jgi:hypothetical protein